jgi:D-lactate dehydrogenase
MKIAVFSTKPYDEYYLNAANRDYNFTLHYFESGLSYKTARLAEGCEAVCIFVNDKVDREAIDALHELGVKYIALRCAGFNNVDIKVANSLRMPVARVPAYSPNAVAEHAVGLMLCLNRRYHRAYNRVREGNFSLNGLIGFDMKGKTVGVVGTGKIGQAVVPILLGFGCRVLAYDLHENPDILAMGVPYVSLNSIWMDSDIVTFHCPLVDSTYHIVNEASLAKMKEGVMLINTSRGGLFHAPALIESLKSGHLGALGLDVYEEEESLFFRDLSNQVIQDDVFSRLLTFPNVLITGHQAFLTDTALRNIAETTLNNIRELKEYGKCNNCVVF